MIIIMSLQPTQKVQDNDYFLLEKKIRLFHL